MRFFILLLCLIITSCGTVGTKQGVVVFPGSCLVVGKLEIKTPHNNISSSVDVYMNDVEGGHYLSKPDARGLLVDTLPLGHNYLAKLAYQNGFRRFDKRFAYFKLTDEDEIHYIGNITIIWNYGKKISVPPDFGKRGAVYSAISDDGRVAIKVEDKMESVVNVFRANYDTDKKITRNLLELKRQ